MKKSDDNKKDEVQKILNSMTTRHAAPLIESVYEFQERHKAVVLNRFGRGIKYQEDSIDLMMRIIYGLNFSEKSHWPSHRVYQFTFFPGALLSLWRGFQDAIEGFYGESVMIIRSIFETYLRIVFISLYPNSWESAVYDKKLKNSPNFNVSNFLDHKLKVDWRWIYKLQSFYTHGKQFEVIQLIGEIMKRTLKRPIAPSLRYNERDFTTCLNYSCILTYAFLTLMRDLFPEIEERLLMQKGKERFQATLKGYKIIVNGIKSKISSTAADIEKISKMVRAAERGEDWESVA